MKTSMRKKVILVLLIAFICRFAQDLFNPYISLDSYTNWTLWSLVFRNLHIMLSSPAAYYNSCCSCGRQRREHRTEQNIKLVSGLC